MVSVKGEERMRYKYKNIFIERNMIFFLGIFWMIIIYSTILVHEIYNLDSVGRIFGVNEANLFIQNGRLWREIGDRIVGYSIYPPKLTLLLVYIILFFTMESTVYIFRVKKLLTKIVILLVMISFPLYALYFEFGSDVVYYALAMYFATKFVEYIIKKKFVIAVIFGVAALFGYQMALSYMTSLIILVGLFKVLNDEFIVKYFFRDCILVVVVALLYYILWKFILVILGVPISSYRNASSLGIITTIKSSPAMLVNQYVQFFNLFIKGFPIYSISKLLNYQYSLLIIFLFMFPIQSSWRIRYKYYTLCIFIPPFLFSASFATLTLGSRLEFGILPLSIFTMIWILEHTTQKALLKLEILFVCIFLLMSGYVINQLFRIELRHNELDTMVVEKIQGDLISHQSYTPYSKVSFCGNLIENENFNWENQVDGYTSSYYEFLRGGPSIFWRMLPTNTPLEDEMQLIRLDGVFRRNGYKINVVASECSSIDKSKPVFPKQGYISTLNNGVYEINLG